MRIIHVVESLFKFGGANVACLDFANRQADYGNDVVVFSTESPNAEVEISPNISNVIRCKRVDLKFARLHYIEGLNKKIKNTLLDFKPDIVHVHALWDPIVHCAIRNCHKMGIPIIHSPHGMLTPWALNNKRLKKQVAWRLYQCDDLKRITAFHVTCEEEKSDLIRLGFKQPIEVIPLGIDLPNIDITKKKRSQTILFMSRIHPKKGLIDLVEAWDKIRKEGWRIAVCGPDDDGHLQVVKNRIKELKLEPFFNFIGSVSGEQKDQLMRECDLFVLPTYSENFGIVILEALSYGIPVITTVGSPWEGLRKYNAGWWTEIGSEPLCCAINEFLHMSMNSHMIMAENARLLAKREFSWEIIINDLLKFYKENLKLL